MTREKNPRTFEDFINFQVVFKARKTKRAVFGACSICIYIYVIYRMGGPYWKNILSRSQKTARGRRPSCCERALRSASLLVYFNVHSSMADKQLKRRLYFLCSDVFILNTAMKKVKLIRFFILSFVLQNKQG